ncbi:hypothetical protein EMMF5_005547 [Cystobasidiomycetes sp. EMM_F5]
MSLRTSGSKYAEPEVSWKSWVAILCASLHTFSSLLSITGAAGVIAFIIQSLGDPQDAVWLISGPTLCQAALAPVLARLSDLTGKKKHIIAVCCLFGVAGAIVGGKATSMQMVIAGQVLIGIAISCVGVTSSIPSEVLPHSKRSYAQATVLYAANAATVIGSLGTGGMVQGDAVNGWRIVYWLLAASYGLTFLGIVFVYNPPTPPDYRKRTMSQLLHDLDVVGSLLIVIALALTLLALNWGGEKYAWSSATVLAPLLIGLASLVAFGIWEWKGRSDGIVDHRIFGLGRNFAVATFALAVEGWVYFTNVAAYVPQEILGLGYASDPIKIGARSFIFTAATFLCAFPISWYVARYKDPRTPLVIGFTLFLVAAAMLSQCKPGTGGDALLMGALAVAGVGFCAPLILLNMVVQLSAPPELIATVTALVASGRAFGGTVGTAVVSTIRTSKLASKLPELVGPAALQAGLPPSSLPILFGLIEISPALIVNVPGLTPQVAQAVIPAYYESQAYAFSYAWYSILGPIALAAVTCACLESVKDKMTPKVDRPYIDSANKYIGDQEAAMGPISTPAFEKAEESTVEHGMLPTQRI